MRIIALFVAVALTTALNTVGARAQNTFSNLINFGGGSSCDPRASADFGVQHRGSYVADFEIFRHGTLIGRTSPVLLGQCWHLPFEYRGQLGLSVKGYAHTGLVWEPRRHFMTVNVGTGAGLSNKSNSVRIFGTTLNPGWEHLRR